MDPRAPDPWLTDGWLGPAPAGDREPGPRRRSAERQPPEHGAPRIAHGLVPALAVGGAVTVAGTAPLVVPAGWLWIAPAVVWPAAIVWALVTRDVPRRV